MDTKMPKPFHLAWFCNFSAGEWDHPYAPTTSPWDGKLYVEMALAMERACFDYIMLEDTLMVSDAWRGTTEATLKHALQAPKHDPDAARRHDRVRALAGWASSRPCPPWPTRLSCWPALSSTIDHIAGVAGSAGTS